MTMRTIKLDDDTLGLARAEISRMVDDLSLINFKNNPVLFLTRLELIRETARANGFAALAEICSAFEIAMERVLHKGGAETVIGNFMEIVRDATEYAPTSRIMAQSFLASVAIRLQR